MKTFSEIFRKRFSEIYKSPEGWPDNLSINDVHENAAKQYAKQWIVRAGYKALYCTDGEEVDAVLTCIKEIDAQ